MVQPVRKFYKLTIHSSNAVQQGVISQSWADSTFLLDFPEILDTDQYQVCVESFTISIAPPVSSGTTGTTSGGITTTLPILTGANAAQFNNASTGYCVSLPGFIQGNSYDTASLSVCPTVLITSGPTFNRFVDAGSLGFRCRDRSFMRGQNLRVTINTLDGTLVPTTFFGGVGSFNTGGVTTATKWAMCLCIYPVS